MRTTRLARLATLAAFTMSMAVPMAVPMAVHAQATPARGISIAALAHQARVRSALGNLMPPERSVPQMGLELGVPTFWEQLRVHGRLLRATGGGDDLHSMEAGLLLTSRFVGVEASYAQRGSYSPSTGLAHGRVAEFGRAGVRTQMGLGGTGLSLHLRANAYLPTWRAASPDDDVEGWDGETGLTYATSALPVSATLGYRLERFRIFGVEQEVSALTFAVAFTLLGR
jgi:hypothetical protein